MYLFSFMRRKTDFFTAEEKSTQTVLKCLTHHQALFREDTKRQELIKQKQAEVKAPKQEVQTGATVEEINDDEATKILEL